MINHGNDAGPPSADEGAEVPFLSIVIPVYGVAGYLRECLDSVLSQPDGGGIEVIAVDDASPDTCGEILDEYAARDGRIRVIHLSANGGAGPARNAGMDAATGDYVWFVDGDDWLAPGAVRAVARRIRETDPDVLLVDFATVPLTLKARRSPLRTQVPDTPAVRKGASSPVLLSANPGVWSRVVRRDHLARTGIRATPGWFPEVGFTYPVTAAAARVSVLHRVCYHHRRRDPALAAGPRGNAFQIFDQYASAWSHLDRLGITAPALRAAFFRRMRSQYLTVFGTAGLVPARSRRAYVRRMAADIRSRRPAAAGQVDRLRHAVLSTGAYPPFAAAWFARKLLGKARAAARKTRAAARLGKRRALTAYYATARLLPLDPHLAVYGAYWGRGYRCNPAAIYEKARELAPSVRGVWVVTARSAEQMPAGVPYVVEGSRRYFHTIARAKYVINNVNFTRGYVKRAGSIVLQTHHGTPLKTMGADHYRYPAGALGADVTALLERCRSWDISISTSPFNTEVWQRAYPLRHETLEIGYPRNDRLATAGAAEARQARASLGLTDGELAVLYAPTHREYTTGFQSPLDVAAFADAVGEDVRVLNRMHYFYDPGSSAVEHPRVTDVSAHADVEALYLAADVLVTDYSSVMFDYAYLDRPIVIFAPDWETYQVTRGVTFDLAAFPPGVFARTVDELVAAFTGGTFDGAAAGACRAAFRERFCPHRHGRSAELAVRRLFLGEKIDAAQWRHRPAGSGAAPPDQVGAEDQVRVGRFDAADLVV